METVSGMDSEQTATDSNISAKWAEATIEVEGRKQALLRSGRLDDSVRSCIEMTIASNDWYRLHRLLEIIITLQLQYGPGHETDTEGVTHVIEQRTDSEKHVRFQGLVHEVKAAIGIEIDLRCFFLGGDRVSLYKAIDKRCVAMLSAGLFDEIVDLFNRRHIYQLPQHTSGYANQSKEVTSTPPSPTASAAIGYRQTVNYLCREKFMEGDFRALLDYIDQFSKVTRNYAKRQMHWYRKDANFLWIHDTSNNNNDKSAQRVAEEIYHWTYMVSRSEYETSLNAQVLFCGES
jgi:tRNA A37 N6-isopentenylltransferase MiaA